MSTILPVFLRRRGHSREALALWVDTLEHNTNTPTWTTGIASPMPRDTIFLSDLPGDVVCLTPLGIGRSPKVDQPLNVYDLCEVRWVKETAEPTR
jgi:hypothetical protein